MSVADAARSVAGLSKAQAAVLKEEGCFVTSRMLCRRYSASFKVDIAVQVPPTVRETHAHQTHAHSPMYPQKKWNLRENKNWKHLDLLRYHNIVRSSVLRAVHVVCGCVTRECVRWPPPSMTHITSEPSSVSMSARRWVGVHRHTHAHARHSIIYTTHTGPSVSGKFYLPCFLRRSVDQPINGGT